MRLEHGVYLVVGGSSGLGEACVAELAAGGARVVVADVQAPSGSPHSTIDYFRMDVTDTQQIEHTLDQVLASHQVLHGVIQCAGILGASRLVTRDGPHDLDLFRRTIEVNLVGTFNVMRLAASRMTGNPPNADGERGVIINTASISAFEGQIGQVAYAASKGGVAAMTLPAARDLASLGIRVVAIAPGVFNTPMIQAAPAAVQQSLENQSVFPKRLGSPAEFARFVRQVIENPMLNGCTLRLDGAVRLPPK